VEEGRVFMEGTALEIVNMGERRMEVVRNGVGGRGR
jgi:hypothetical protein